MLLLQLCFRWDTQKWQQWLGSPTSFTPTLNVQCFLTSKKHTVPFQLSVASDQKKGQHSCLGISHWLQWCHWRLNLKSFCLKISSLAGAKSQHLLLTMSWAEVSRKKIKIQQPCKWINRTDTGHLTSANY